jgi:(methylthio)acryloyl-CoA hydratase
MQCNGFRPLGKCIKATLHRDELAMSPDYSAPHLPASLRAERQGDVGILWLKRGQKHVSLDEQTILGIDTYFANLAEGIKAVVFVSKDGDFSDARDLNEWMNGTTGNIEQAHLWRRACDSIQFGEVPVVAVLGGPALGGDLELAASAHIRVAERSAFYALPQGSTGIYLGNSPAVRLVRLIGVARVTDMMLTGRRYSAEEGQAMGLSTYLVDNGRGLAKGLELAEHIAANATLFSGF